MPQFKKIVSSPSNGYTMDVASTIIWEGHSEDDHQTMLTAGTVSQDNTVTLPDETGVLTLNTGSYLTGTRNLTFGINSHTAGSSFAISHPNHGTAGKLMLLTTSPVTDDTTITLPAMEGTVALCGAGATAQNFHGGINIGAGITSNSFFLNPNGSIQFQGLTHTNGYRTDFAAIDPTGNNLIKLPDDTGTLALCDGTSGVTQNFNSYIHGIGFTGGAFTANNGSNDNGQVVISSTHTNSTTVAGGIRFYGPTHDAGDYTTLAPIQPTDARIIELPDASGTVALQPWVQSQNYMENLVDDTTPQLSGDLDLNGNNISNIDGCKIYWTGESIQDREFQIEVLNNGFGDGILRLAADKFKLGGQIDVANSSLVQGAFNDDWHQARLATAGAINDRIMERTGWEGSSTKVKVRPQDFMLSQNDDHEGVMDSISTIKPVGISIADTGVKLYACVSIPEDYKATGIKLIGSNSANRFMAWEGCVNGCNAIELYNAEKAVETSQAAGATDFDTDMVGGPYNYVLIEFNTGLSLTATTDKLYGGYIEIERVYS